MEQEKSLKTCTIDKLITVAADIEQVLRGEKTATRRNGRYADIGEVFDLHGVPFVVTEVYRQRIENMTEQDFRMEGYPGAEQYFDRILSMHSGMTMDMLQTSTVWVHEFKPLSRPS